ncbi:hypothetical protein [Deinococcus maricopensis]|uniref:Uncharacterized protein n=1 Tax=Deinococcus maricopensis (strain DSM 21211 / LMG 22137 / NRRL B-23946 / LB-34) TaxID=709986 RepID=E8U528_DEIML|nr:hypothetical protein [Deinococcus maricopensis]ADV66167.1 hypothetical protein Deima_0508 [Deinococcus maricopensis DSM 21211]
MASISLPNVGRETAWGLVWRAPHLPLNGAPAATGTAGGTLVQESELLAVQGAAEHLAALGWTGRITLHCDDIQVVRQLGGLVPAPGPDVLVVRERLEALGVTLKHVDRERTAARAAHQQARLTLSQSSAWRRLTRAMRSEAEAELPRLLRAVAHGEETSPARFQKGGLLVQLAHHQQQGRERLLVTLSVQKAEGRSVLLHEGPLDTAPAIVRRIAQELTAYERDRVEARLGRRALPGNPEELRSVVLELLAEGGVDGMPFSHLSQLLHGVELQVLKDLASAWPEVQVTMHGRNAWLRLRQHPRIKGAEVQP